MKKVLLSAVALLGIAAPAIAADLPARMAVKAPVIVDPIYDWTGFYIGGNVGYSWGRARTQGTASGVVTTDVFRTASGPGTPLSVITTTPIAPFALPGGSYNVDGVIGGGQAGYNWQSGTWLYGLEADFQGSGERGRFSSCSIAGCPAGAILINGETRLDWFGTGRARIGYLPTPKLVLYGTGGVAYGHLRSSFSGTVIGGGPTFAASSSSTRVGWTAGAGAEAALDRNWSVKLEYLYMDLGRFASGAAGGTSVVTVANVPTQAFSTQTTTTVNGNVSTRFTDHIVRVGVNYRFGGPVVARY